MEKRFDKVDSRFDRIDIRFEKIDNEFKEIRKEMKSDFRWLLAMITAVGGIMAHGFHWF